MTTMRWFLVVLAVADVLLGVYWGFMIGAAAGVAEKEPARLATALTAAHDWEPERLRPYLDPPWAADSPDAFGRAAAAPARSVLDPMSLKVLGLLCFNGIVLVGASVALRRAGQHDVQAGDRKNAGDRDAA